MNNIKKYDTSPDRLQHRFGIGNNRDYIVRMLYKDGVHLNTI